MYIDELLMFFLIETKEKIDVLCRNTGIKTEMHGSY